VLALSGKAFVDSRSVEIPKVQWNHNGFRLVQYSSNRTSHFAVHRDVVEEVLDGKLGAPYLMMKVIFSHPQIQRFCIHGLRLCIRSLEHEIMQVEHNRNNSLHIARVCD